jgi:RHS repeat-associated protein
MGRILKHTDPQGVLHEFFNDPAGDRLITQVSGSGSASTVVGRNDEWQRQGSHQGTHYRFDRAGNLTHKQDSQQLLELAWDANQRLIASRRTTREETPSVTTYGYDPLGRRLFKETQGQRTWFGWDGDAMTLDVIDRQAREFIYRNESQEPLAMLASQPLFYVNDPNGCPTRLVDSKGQPQWSAQTSAWGEAEKLHSYAIDNPIRLQGQYADHETGLNYNRFRYYAAEIGSYVSADPIGLAAGPNCHLYADGRPWIMIDPLGLAGDPANATHIQYEGVKNGKPYVGYASKPGLGHSGTDVLKYRYPNTDDFDDAPNVKFVGNGQSGKDVARGLEQRRFEDLGGLGKTSNLQNPVGIGNKRRDIYLKAADDYRAAKTVKTAKALKC